MSSWAINVVFSLSLSLAHLHPQTRVGEDSRLRSHVSFVSPARALHDYYLGRGIHRPFRVVSGHILHTCGRDRVTRVNTVARSLPSGSRRHVTRATRGGTCYSSPTASLVLTDSFEKLPDQIMYPYGEPYDLIKYVFSSCRF
uniref:Secreted protein n=1 Tax=Timema douglasi TaxID=61478 RepID=A0A7R8VXZ6_TIMDO|nr:unnamed protein product [Timema douglasi]